MKTCNKCNQVKDLNKFRENRKTCVLCRNKRRATLKTRSGIGLKEYNLKRLYGLSLERYQEMIRQQQNTCAICKKTDNGPWKTLAVDHCHQTGQVRALLCAKCNKGLGQFNDSPELLQKAVQYLLSFKILRVA